MIEDLWERVLVSAMKLPGIAVDRREFLGRELAPYFDREVINAILDGSTKMKNVLPQKVVQKLAEGCISYHLTKASLISAVAGIPGGFTMLATIPADMAQFYGHVLALAQKLLYLYGWPDLQNGGKGMDDGTKQILTLFVGVAFGSSQAAIVAKKIAERLAEEAVQRVPQTVLGQLAARGIVEQAGKWIGVQIAKNGTEKSLAKLIPFIGAPISAAATYYSFKPMARRLKKHLDEQW